MKHQQDTQESEIYNLFNEILDKSPNITPTGHIFVQKKRFLKKTITKTVTKAAIPTIDKVRAEPKYVYGSIYLSKTALPPAKAPNTTAEIKYFAG